MIEECCSGIENVRKWKCSRTVMRICPVCPVMEIIVPVDVTDVEQEAAQALWDLLLRQYMHNTEIAVTMRLSTILKTIKQPL